MTTPKEHIASIVAAMYDNPKRPQPPFDALRWALPILQSLMAAPYTFTEQMAMASDLESRTKDLDIPGMNLPSHESVASVIEDIKSAMRKAAGMLRAMPPNPPTSAEREAIAKELEVFVNHNGPARASLNRALESAARMLRSIPMSLSEQDAATNARELDEVRGVLGTRIGEGVGDSAIRAMKSLEMAQDCWNEQAKIRPILHAKCGETTLEAACRYVDTWAKLERTQSLLKDTIQKLREAVNGRADSTAEELTRRAIADLVNPPQYEALRCEMKAPQEESTIDAVRRIVKGHRLLVDGWGSQERAIRDLALAQPEESTIAAVGRVVSDLATLDRERKNRESHSNKLQEFMSRNMMSASVRNEIQSWHQKATGESNRSDRSQEHRERQANRSEVLESVLGLFVVTMQEQNEAPSKTEE